MLVGGEVAPVTGDLGVEGAGAKKLNLWDLQKDTICTMKLQLCNDMNFTQWGV